jgi:hypothetical protein
MEFVELQQDPRGFQAMEGCPDYSIQVAMEKFEYVVHPMLFSVYVERKTCQMKKRGVGEYY